MNTLQEPDGPSVVKNYMVDGMSCKGCVASVLVALRTVPGVYSVSLDLENSKAEVEFDPTVEAAESNMKSSVEKLGYRFGPLSA